MKQIKIEYTDVAEYYMHLIRSGATEFTKPFNNLKFEGCTHNLSIQAVNYILDQKYNDKILNQNTLEQIQANFKYEKDRFDVKVKIFRYYSQALNSFTDESITIEGITKNTGLPESDILKFLAEYNEKLGLNFTSEEQIKNIRTILDKIWS